MPEGEFATPTIKRVGPTGAADRTPRRDRFNDAVTNTRFARHQRAKDTS
jgi:hypothetical protein